MVNELKESTTISKEQSPVEKGLVYVIQVIIVTSIIGLFTILLNISKTLAVVETKVNTNEQQLTAVTLLMRDRYTSDDAIRDFKAVYERIGDFESRIRDLEHKADKN